MAFSLIIDSGIELISTFVLFHDHATEQSNDIIANDMVMFLWSSCEKKLL